MKRLHRPRARRGCGGAKKARNRMRNKEHRQEARRRLHSVRVVPQNRKVHFQRRRKRDSRLRGRIRRPRRRLARILRGGIGAALRPARPPVLRGRRALGGQNRRVRGLLPQRGRNGGVRQAEQIFSDEQYAGSPVAVLEPDSRQHARRGGARRRGFANHADAGRQHRVDDEIL